MVVLALFAVVLGSQTTLADQTDARLDRLFAQRNVSTTLNQLFS
jgi:hypothetical protein